MKMYSMSVRYSNALLAKRIRGGRLLDIGGAEFPGRACHLAQFVDEVVMVDIAPPPADLPPNVSFSESPAENLPAELGLFDNILLSNVLEHLADPLLVLRNISKVLAPRGSVHILTPNCESLNRRVGVLMGILKDIKEIPSPEIAIGHRHAFSVSDMTNLVLDAGYIISEILGIYVKPVPTDEMIQWPENRIKAFFDVASQLPPEVCHEVYFRAVKPPRE